MPRGAEDGGPWTILTTARDGAAVLRHDYYVTTVTSRLAYTATCRRTSILPLVAFE